MSKKAVFFEKNSKKVCTVQKKAVPLHAFFGETKSGN